MTETDASLPGSALVAAPDLAIRVSDLSVEHGNGRRVLDTVAFSVDKGEFVAIHGPSGGGKSTLLQVLAGFQAPTEGIVSVCGQRPGTLAVGWLGQTPYLRQDSWAGNLRLAAPEASERQLMEALARVGLAQLVRSRPHGLDSPIDEEGGGLSGGQARRLALARVFLARYPLVLMDEPTAALDARSEHIVIEALQALREEGVTLLVTSHHPAVLASADRCLGMQQGRLVP